jgi:hypothetical protein
MRTWYTRRIKVPTREYTLDWLLPFVRKGMQGVGATFGYRDYAESVLMLLHAAHEPGLVKNDHFHASTGNAFDDAKVPRELKNLLAEAHFYLLRHGYIAPEAADSYKNAPKSDKFNVTRPGRDYFNGSDPIPEDARSYLEFVRQLLPNLDTVIMQYIVEALKAFEREAYFATAVMIGAASEKAIYLLADSLAKALKQSARRTTLEKALGGRSLSALLDHVRETIETESAGKKAPIPYSASEGASAHLASLFEAIRTQRNDAVHPMKGTVSASSVRLLLHSLPAALDTTEAEGLVRREPRQPLAGAHHCPFVYLGVKTRGQERSLPLRFALSCYPITTECEGSPAALESVPRPDGHDGPSALIAPSFQPARVQTSAQYREWLFA